MLIIVYYVEEQSSIKKAVNCSNWVTGRNVCAIVAELCSGQPIRSLFDTEPLACCDLIGSWSNSVYGGQLWTKFLNKQSPKQEPGWC